MTPSQPTPSTFDLFTIGHSNHPIARFLALIEDAGATAVADVRSQPVSRRFPWFSASRLAGHLDHHGMSYLPMGDTLGGRPREPRLFRDGVADYEAMARTPEFHTGVDRVMEAMKSARVCLMCAEREPLDCHRCLLVAPALAARGLNIGHIMSDGRIVPHAEIEEQLLAAAGEDLFGDRNARLADAYRRRAAAVAFRLRD